MEITAADALTKIQSDCFTSASPAVPDEKVEEIIALCAMPDDGILTGTPNPVNSALWVESYDINRACAMVWEWRLGQLFATIDVDAGPNKQKKSQKFEQCKKMAAMYRSRLATSFAAGEIDEVGAARLPVVN